MCTDQSDWPDDIAWIGNPNTAANNSGAYKQNAISNFTTEFHFHLPVREIKSSALSWLPATRSPALSLGST
jgi:hypothetical protein